MIPLLKAKKDRENNLYIKQKYVSVEETIHQNQIRMTIQSRDLSDKCVPQGNCPSVISNKGKTWLKAHVMPLINITERHMSRGSHLADRSRDKIVTPIQF